MADARSSIAEIYIAAFNRVPDTAGLAFWVDSYNKGKTLSAISQEFTNSVEYKAMYPSFLTSTEYVTKIYLNVFARDAALDPTGLAFWVGKLDDKSLTQGTIMQAMLDAAHANGSADGPRLTNEADFGVYCASNNIEPSKGTPYLTSITADPATVTVAEAAISSNTGLNYTLTNQMDIKTANLFTAPQVYTPGGNDLINSLQDMDQLTGTGNNPTLNATIGNNVDTLDANIMPTMTGVSTVNVAFNATGYYLDLQDTTGVSSVNITRMDQNAAVNGFRNMTAVPVSMSVSNSSANATLADFTVNLAGATGTADASALTVSNVSLAQLRIADEQTFATDGVETLTLHSAGGRNTLTQLTNIDMETLVIDGSANLTIGTIAHGVDAVSRFKTIDATAATGSVNLTIDAALNADMRNTTGTGTAVNFSLKTGSGNDTLTVNATGAVIGNAADTIDGGSQLVGGADTVAFRSGVTNTFTDATSANFDNYEALTVTRITDAAVAPTNITINASKITGDQTIRLQNLGDATDGLATYTINNLGAVEANQITIAHSNNTNNGLVDNLINATLATATGTTDTVGVTIVDGLNAEARFNFGLTAGGVTAATMVENINLVDNDTESNTVQLNNFARHTGTITLTGAAAAGQFMNLDAAANSYGYNLTGATGDATATAKATFVYVNPNYAATVSQYDAAVGSVFNSAAGGELLVATKIDASTYAGDVIARVGTATQNIQLGTGNDTIIFADRAGITNITSGLTISDTVAGGTGSDTIVLDGAGPMVLGASEWTNLTGIDTLRLSGAAASTFEIRLTNQFVGQTDAANMLNIVNNDGIIGNVAENAATINLRDLDASHFITFTGANGDGIGQAARAAQTVILNDVTANGNSVLNGGDRDIVTIYSTLGGPVNGAAFATQAAADAAWLANSAANVDGNNNMYQVYNTAEVTIGDLANVSNFSTIKSTNDLATATRMTLTLDDTTVGRMVDASHTASATAVETLRIVADDNMTAGLTGAFAQLTVNASTVSNAYSLNVFDARGVDNLTLGAGVDTVVMIGNYAAGVYGNDAATGVNVNTYANNTAGQLAVTDVINARTAVSTEANALVTYGAINLDVAQLNGITTVTAHSDITMTDAQLAALTGGFNFSGTTAHALTITHAPGFAGQVDLANFHVVDGAVPGVSLTVGADVTTINQATSIFVPPTPPKPLPNNLLDGQNGTFAMVDGAQHLTDTVAKGNNLILTGCGADDDLTVKGATVAQYEAAQAIKNSTTGDVTITYVAGTETNTVVLKGIGVGTKAGVLTVKEFDDMTTFGKLTLDGVTPDYKDEPVDGRTDTIDASLAKYNFTELVTLDNSVTITNFSADDKITVTGATSVNYDSAISTVDSVLKPGTGDVVFNYVDAATSKINTITIVGVVTDPAHPVANVSDFNALGLGQLFFA